MTMNIGAVSALTCFCDDHHIEVMHRERQIRGRSFCRGEYGWTRAGSYETSFLGDFHYRVSCATADNADLRWRGSVGSFSSIGRLLL